jgi:response regulator RpfG family c-di-GMP phosphodiesterase
MNRPVIFYADDDDDDRLLFKEAAETIPGTVILFESGVKMVSSLRQFMPRPSIIFVDLNMPVKSGFEIVQELKESKSLKNIPVVVLSTASDPYNVDKVRNCGANYYIPKPPSFCKLRRSLEFAFKIDWHNFRPPFEEFLHRHQL